MEKTLFDEVKELGINYDYYKSDLYLPYTPENLALVKKYFPNSRSIMYSIFVSNKPEDKKSTWIEIVFAYTPGHL